MTGICKRWGRLISILMVIAMVFPIIPVEAGGIVSPDDQVISDQSAVEPADEFDTAVEPDTTAESNTVDETNTSEEMIEATEVEPEEIKAESFTNSISGLLWLDIFENVKKNAYHGDGIRQPEEQPVSGYQVSLYKTDDKVTAVQTALTDRNGEYKFEQMDPGNYIVGISTIKIGEIEYLLPVVGITKDNQFADFADDYATVYSKPMEIKADTVVTDVNAGMRTPPSIQPRAGSYQVTRNDTSALIGTYSTVATAVSACLMNIPCTITVMQDDPDMNSNAVLIPSGKDITVTSDGSANYTITQTASSYSSYFTGRHFEVAGILTLENITLSGLGITSGPNTNGGVGIGASVGTVNFLDGAKITDCSGPYGGAVYVLTGEFIMNGGEITGNWAWSSGGGIHVKEHGALTMEDGEIIDNIAGAYGGGVYLEGATGVSTTSGIFNMKDGKITGNTSVQGGGVHMRRSRFTMDGGEITGNTSIGTAASLDGGGGVYLSMGTFTMNGGKINSNMADNAGGGLLMSTGTFIMTDGEISNNTSFTVGGGIYMWRGAATMDNGEITNNTSSSHGGGVFIAWTAFTVNQGEISDNTAGDHGGGIYTNDGSFVMNQGNITNNVAASDGGGVYTLINSYADPVVVPSYTNIGIASTVVVSGNIAGQSYTPPVNASYFTTRATNPFDGTLLNNDNINYRNPYLFLEYNANNSSGVIYNDPTSYVSGNTVPTLSLAATGITADPGDVFSYWCTTADGTGTKYYPGDTITMGSGNLVLHAIWNATYTLTYDVNGGNPNGPTPVTGLVAQLAYILDTTTIPTHAPVAGKNVVFVGWTALPDSHFYEKTDTMPAIITSTAILADTTVYAVWGYDTNGSTTPDIKDLKYTLTFHTNGGTPVPAVQILLVNELAVVPSPVPTKLNHTFGGWYQDDNTFLVPWTFATDTISANKDLYAKWIKDTYTINIRYVDRNNAVVASAGVETATYSDPFTATAISVSGKTYAGWYMGATAPALSTVNATTVVPHIASVSPTDHNTTITLVYDQNGGGGGSSGGGGGGGGTPSKTTYTVTEKHMSGTKLLATYSRTVNEGSTYNGTVDNSLPKSYTYNGYRVDSSTMTGIAPNLPAITNVQKNYTVVMEYTADQCEVTVTYEYHANNGKVTVLPGSQKATVAGGSSFTPTIPNFKQKVQTGWTLNGKSQTGSPMVKSVTGTTAIVLIYQQDMDEDGKHDYTIKELCVNNTSGKILQSRTIYVTAGKNYSAVPKQINHYSYIGYRIDSGKLQKGSNPAILAVNADHIVEMLYTPKVYKITVKVVDQDGKTISGKGYTVEREYQQRFVASPPQVKDYEFVEWLLDGKWQMGDVVEIASVEKDAIATAVFQKLGTMEPQTEKKEKTKQKNYEFAKKPNVKMVAAGQTVKYTFSDFGNKWGVPLERYSIIDTPDKGLDFVSANLPAFTRGAGVTYSVYYFTKNGGAKQYVIEAGISAAKAHSVVAPKIDSGDYITMISIEFGKVPVGFAVGDTIQMSFRVWDNPPASKLTNIGILGYKIGDEYKKFVSDLDGGSIFIKGFIHPPQTGDQRDLALTYALMGVSLSGLIMLTDFNKRKKRKSA